MKSNLAAFMKNPGPAAVVEMTPAGSQSSAVASTRQRGKGAVVSLTVRLSRAEWERVHQLALSEGMSINALALKGLGRLFKEKGLPEIV